MAENGGNIPGQQKITENILLVDKELRLRNLKEKQSDERQRKLEEIKAQAMAAQRFKEQKEYERRQRLEHMRVREEGRRMQVEERKRAINDAERDRLESIIRRNQQREVRLETKKRHERSNLVFAFGSSTPRNLDPHDVSTSFWGYRRATSTQNIPSSASNSLTRRQSERDLDNGGKKRATSAGGLERTGEGSIPTTPAGCASGYLGRRRTDLVPTIPTRDSTNTSSRKSLSHSPGRAYSMTRLDQLSKPRKKPDLPVLAENTSYPFRLLSSPRQSSVTRSMSHLAVSKLGASSQVRKPLNKSDSRSMHQLCLDGPLVLPRPTRATQLRQQKLLATNASDASSRPSSSLSQQSSTSVTSSVSVRHRPFSGQRKQRPASIAITGISHDLKHVENKKSESKPPLPRTRKLITKSTEKVSRSKTSSGDSTPKTVISPTATVITSIAESKVNGHNGILPKKPPDTSEPLTDPPAVTTGETLTQVLSEQVIEDKNEKNLLNKDIVMNEIIPSEDVKDIADIGELEPVCTSDIVKVTTEEYQPDITTIEIMQEIAKKPDPEVTIVDNVNNKFDTLQHEFVVTTEVPEEKTMTPIVSLAVKSEVLVEITPESTSENSTLPVDISFGNKVEDTENQLQNVLSNSLLDNSDLTTSFIKSRINTEEEAKAALAERRRVAREEAERRAEQERQRIEMEAKRELERQQQEEEQLRLLIEAQRLAEQQRLDEAIKEAQKKEEDEKKRREEEHRLKLLKEEADRKAKDEAEKQKLEQQERLKNEEKEREARRKRVEAIMLRTRKKNNANTPELQSFEDTNENKSENKVNGTKPVEQNNGTKNGKDQIVDNIIPDETLKNANDVSIDTINNTTDSINSNNSWQTTQQYGNFVCNNNS